MRPDGGARRYGLSMASLVAAEPQPDKKKDVGCFGTIGTFLAIALLCWIAFKACTSFGGDSDKESERDARIACTQLVKDRLKSPSSADVSRGSITGSDGVYEINGTYDADNSFGAKIHGTYTCHMDNLAGTVDVSE